MVGKPTPPTTRTRVEGLSVFGCEVKAKKKIKNEKQNHPVVTLNGVLCLKKIAATVKMGNVQKKGKQTERWREYPPTGDDIRPKWKAGTR